MKKILRSSAIAALALAFAASHPARPQSAPARDDLPKHLAPNAVSPADSATIQAHQAELTQAARIYIYNLEAGNWDWEQTVCASMPRTIMLHYFQRFPDGTESLFTALIPRETGRVRIVPILYHNKTPYLPAPKNPRNYAVFNEVVPPEIAARAIDPNSNAVELGICYAEMTGGWGDIPRDWGSRLQVSSALLEVAHAERLENAIRVFLPDRANQRDYQFWTITFNRYGRITSVQTEDHAVYMAKSIPQGSPTSTASTGATGVATPVQPVTGPQPVQPGIPQQPASRPANAPARAVATPVIHTAAAGTVPQPSSVETPAQASAPEPGWKYVLNPSQPKEKVVAPTEPPREKVVALPPDPEEKSAPQNQSQQ